MRYGSMFSGVGGMDLGFHRAGWDAVFFAESDAYRRRVLERHWPGVCQFSDVRDVSERKLRDLGCTLGDRPQRGRDGLRQQRGGRADAAGPKASELDLLCGGFPCQDVSVAGQRAGLAGARSGLFFEFARAADQLVRPGGWIVIENVPGLFTSHGGRDFGVVVRTLGDIGFHDLAWRVLDSRYFGVPQRRRRVFIVARRAAGQCAQAVLLEREGCGWDFASGGPAWASSATSAVGGAESVSEDRVLTQSLTRRFGNSGVDFPDAEANWVISSEMAAPLTKGSAAGEGVSVPGRRKEDDVNLVVYDEVAAPVMSSKFGARTTDVDTGTYVSAPVTAKWAKGNGGPAGDEVQNLTVTGATFTGNDFTESGDQSPPVRSVAERHATPLAFIKRHGANHAEDHETWGEGDTARALNGMGQAGTNGALVAEQFVRRLTPTECERLQALPDGWTYPDGPSLAHVPFVPLTAAQARSTSVVDRQPDGPRYAACGDAVTASVAEWIADRIARVRPAE